VKKLLLISLIVIISFVFFGCQQKEEDIAPISQLMDQKLDSAVLELSQGDILTGIESLLDAIVLTNPKGFISDDFDGKIREAKSEIQKENIDGALDLIKSARFLLSSQEIKQEDAVETNPAPIAEAVKTLILGAKNQFLEGNALEGITSILDALLLFKPL